MASNEVPSFKEIWDAVPGSTAPRTLDAAIEFLNQVDAIDIDNAGINVFEILAVLVHELRELNTNLKSLKTEIAGNAAGELATTEGRGLK